MFNSVFRNFYVITSFSVMMELLLTWIQGKSLFKLILGHHETEQKLEFSERMKIQNHLEKLRGFFSNYKHAFEKSHQWKTNYHRNWLIMYSIIYKFE